MRQVYAAASWLFGCLAVALLAVGTLAVPTQMALADSGSCEDECAAQCAPYGGPGTPAYDTCYFNCVQQCQMQQNDCTNSSKCTPCNFPCDDSCFGMGNCGPNFCNCVQKQGGGCKCDPK